MTSKRTAEETMDSRVKNISCAALLLCETSPSQLKKMSHQQTLTRGGGTMSGNVTRTSSPNISGVCDPTTFGPSLPTNRGVEPIRGLPGGGVSTMTEYLGGRIKQPRLDSNAFNMTLEDFPALPGATFPTTTNEPTENPENEIPSTSQPSGFSDQRKGKVIKTPSEMLEDQFGMIGLVTSMRAAETHPNLSSLAHGVDLTALGLNLNTADDLYPTFGGPLSHSPLRAEDMEHDVPNEYNIGHELRQTLAPLNLIRFEDELLFHLFYNYTGDILQMLAASELYKRNWRYHIKEMIWIISIPGVEPVEKGTNFERGTYHVFDPASWGKVAKEMYIDYDKLEGRPLIPHLSSS